MIKRRTRPQQRTREASLDAGSSAEESDHAEKLPLAELIELRKLKKLRQGIDINKLHKGDERKKKKKKSTPEEEPEGGLRAGAKASDDEDDEEDQEAKTRRVVRANNFTQQTNALDVNKHMMQYIEENIKILSKTQSSSQSESRQEDPQDELFRISERLKVDRKAADEGNVTNSIAMLTAIPEVDLGMDTRLKNIEETEKAKRIVAEERKDRKRPDNSEEHLVASRFYRPNKKQKSDAEIMREAQLEAMGRAPKEERRRPYNDRPQMATDEVVMERFKKRMRK